MDPILDTEVEAPEPSLRDTIESAIEEHGEPTAPLETPAKPEQPELPLEAPKPEVPAKPEVAKPEVAKPEVAAKPGKPEPLKAPTQWKPHVREQWNKLPRVVQEEVLRREADNLRLIGSVGPKIRAADELANHLTPYAERLQASGVQPMQFVGDVFDTIKGLAFGNQQDKAELVANIVTAYGVDLRILDSVLSGRIHTPPEVAQARQMTAEAKAVIERNARMQAQSQDHEASLQAERSITAFGADPKHEFFEDVRDMMADLLENGRAKTMEDAYASAVWANPDTRKILLQREAQQRVTSRSQRAQAARRASSSISGSPNNPSAALGGGTLSLRDTLEAAFDEHSP